MRIASNLQCLVVAIALVGVSLTGCTTGKFGSTMSSLAFWKKDKSANKEVVQPPSRSFEARSDLAKSGSKSSQPVPPSAKTSPLERESLAATPNNRQPIRKPYSFESDMANTASPEKSYSTSAMDTKALNTIKPLKMPDPKSMEFNLPEVNQEPLTAKTYQPPSDMNSFELPRERTYSTIQPKLESSTESSMATQDAKSRTVKNPFVDDRSLTPIQPNKSIATSDDSIGQNFGQQTGYTEYSKTQFGEFTSQPRNTTGQSSNVTTNNFSASAANTEPSSSGGSSGIPESLKQGQGSYAPGSVRPPKPISFGSGGSTSPTSTMAPESSSPAMEINRSSGFQMN